MTKLQESIIRCAYADLLGAYQANTLQSNPNHDWDGHLETIKGLEAGFPELLSDMIAAK